MNPEENTTPMGTDEGATDAPAPEAMPTEGDTSEEAPAEMPADAPVESPSEEGDNMATEDAPASDDAGM